MKVDNDEIVELQAHRLVNVTQDTKSPLRIVKYTDSAMRRRFWASYPTLMHCRGLIIEPDGHVVAKPFKKFFNVGEFPDGTVEFLQAYGVPEVSHKLDGSLGILFRAGEAQPYRIATQQSFNGEQATFATKLWADKYNAYVTPDPRYTYLFEIIYPANRIVVDYGSKADITLIGLVETETGRELSYKEVIAHGEAKGLPVIELEDPDDLERLKARDVPNAEGYVLFWADKQERVKVKFDSYLRMHRMINGISAVKVWDLIRIGINPSDMRNTLPEEYYEWFDRVHAEMLADVSNHRQAVEQCVNGLTLVGLMPEPGDDDVTRREKRKAAARIIMDDYQTIREAVFQAISGREYENVLWEMAKPEDDGVRRRYFAEAPS